MACEALVDEAARLLDVYSDLKADNDIDRQYMAYQESAAMTAAMMAWYWAQLCLQNSHQKMVPSAFSEMPAEQQKDIFKRFSMAMKEHQSKRPNFVK